MIEGDPCLHGDYLRSLSCGGEDGLMADLFRDSIPHGGSVVDAGAFLGHHTLIAARQVGPGGRVMAFEPNPASYRALRENVRENGYEKRVIALPLGIGAWSGRRSFYFGDDDPHTGDLFVPERWMEPEATRTVNFDSAIGGRAIDVVKLAVRGNEVEVLRGMRRTLELSPDVRLFVECDPTALSRAGTSVESLLEELRDLELRTRVVDEERRELVPTGAWLDFVPGNVQLVCEPASVSRRLARRVLGPRREPAIAVPA